MRWLLRAQHADGSFGNTLPLAKERLLSTLSAVVALADLPERYQDASVHRARTTALTWLYDHTGDWQTGIDTAGFELLLPALLDEARARELPLPYERFAGISARREAKIGHIPPRLIYRVDTPLLHSLEFLGDTLDTVAVKERVASNGSIANSPSATAFYLRQAEDGRARTYLDTLVRRRGDGSVPMVEPFEVFETAWVLFNLSLAGDHPRQAQPHLLGLARALTEDGVGVSAVGLRPDADDTALTLSVLHRYGYPISAGPLRPFEGVDYFLTFPLERDASVTANAHVLDVLQRSTPFPRQQVMQQKVVRFLRDVRVDGDHWTDKWHGSPFYATAHAVFALTALAPDLCTQALRWLSRNQLEDGSWGWFGKGTAEETAYAVQAWLTVPEQLRQGLRIDLDKADDYLREKGGETQPQMWIGKTVYAIEPIVSSAILSARLLLARRRP